MSWLERKIPLPEYSDPVDEKINTVTHLFGTALAVGAFILTLFLTRSVEVFGFKSAMIVFSSSNILLYLSSTLYHALKAGNAKRLFRILDHSTIYILISGTYTPILIYIGSPVAYKLLAALWAVSLAGIAITILFWKKLRVLHIAFYVIMGWLCVIFAPSIFPYIPSGLIKFLALGGVSYTSGLVFYGCKKIPHYHGIWHMFVLLGSLFFYIGILIYLV